MREILFRAKTAKEGDWIEGDLLHDGYDYDVAIWEKNFKLVTEIDPSTVGQYTCLTDKNGKKIFDGDVCRFYGDDGYSDYAVFWDDTVSQWTVRQIDLGANDVLDSYFAECCEVIGNIHDNPELLEVSDNG